MIEVTVREDETLEQALKRFRRKIRKEGLMEQIRSLMQYEKPSAKRRRKARLAARRAGQKEAERPPRTSTVRLVPDVERETRRNQTASRE